MRTPSTSILVLTALLAIGCAQIPQATPESVSALAPEATELQARGPGAVFDSIDAAAIDALTYCYLEARETGDTGRMRAGTIEPAGSGYTYREIHVANPMTQRRIEYVLGPHDVARFHFYPPQRDRELNRINERLSTTDWRSVSVVDPLHRALYVLHPSLAIRAYRGGDSEAVEVASLQGPQRQWEWPSFFANR